MGGSMKCKECGEEVEERESGYCYPCESARLINLRPSRYVPVPKKLRRKFIIDGKEED